jgi:hypothetical protein
MNNKVGFQYYNVDTDRYQDIRIKRLKKDCGCIGISVYDYILCEIYRVKGCFLEWNESCVFDVSEYFGIRESQVDEVVKLCCAVGLFDKDVLASGGVLTSSSIQRRYSEMCTKSKRKNIAIPEAINLIKNVQTSGVLPQNAGSLEQNSGSLPQNSGSLPQSKVKKSKVKNPPPPLGDECDVLDKNLSFETVWEQYEHKGNRKTSERKWNSLPKKARELAVVHIPKYVLATPEKQYRKNFETYINQEAWNDEIISKTDKPTEPQQPEKYVIKKQINDEFNV